MQLFSMRPKHDCCVFECWTGSLRSENSMRLDKQCGYQESTEETNTTMLKEATDNQRFIAINRCYFPGSW